jgi:hypothetical protein
MIGSLLPVGVATAEAFGDDPRTPVFPGAWTAVRH